MLVRPTSGQLAGVLDWGDSRIGDPAMDFAGLFEVNHALGRYTVHAYGEDSGDFLGRVEVYWRMLPFYEILYGIYSGSERIVKMGVREAQRRLAEQFG